MGRRAAWVAFATALAAVLLGGLALRSGLSFAERSQHGNVIVSLNGGIAPRKLPRERLAPVAVHLAGEIGTNDGSTLPRMKRITIDVAGREILSTRGLPVCPQARLRNSTGRQAMERCGGALVGHGRFDASVFLPGQAPFPLHAQLLAFNGRAEAGGAAVLVHAYVRNPPVSVVVPFVVQRGTGPFPIRLVGMVPAAVGPWPRVGHFEMTFARRFRYRGASHSYLNASCPVPPRFTAGFLAFARATYGFSDGSEVSAETVRSCRVRSAR